jgi:hypothetical protein
VTRQELMAALVKESGNDTECLVVFQDSDSGEVFLPTEVRYQRPESHEGATDAGRATLFIRGEAY